jgi:hypothetical protein
MEKFAKIGRVHGQANRDDETCECLCSRTMGIHAEDESCGSFEPPPCAAARGETGKRPGKESASGNQAETENARAPAETCSLRNAWIKASSTSVG